MKVLDWAGFTGAVSFTFDDNTPSQMPNYEALKATGGHFTFFVVSGWLTGSSDAAKFKATIADGQEIANHTKSHQAQASQSDLQAAEDWISQNMGVTAYSMAAPNGDTSWNSVAPSVVFQNRGVSNALVKPRDSSDPFQLPAYIPPSGADSATMDSQITTAKAANAWRIFCIHGFDSQKGTYQPVPIENVTTTMSHAVDSGLWVEGITNVGAYWAGQKLISATATTGATWTLPAHFPQNMCVRMTTTGGKVTQNGQEVPWDEHGYYQISLDAGEVTIQ
jgi:peptidoglycan/xylan/chitin deacetylase (PgdA/CDA1 family)